jgi:hypothetical protein
VAIPFYFPNLPNFFGHNYRTFLGGVHMGTKGFQDMARKIALKREIVTKRALNTSFEKNGFGPSQPPQQVKTG